MQFARQDKRLEQAYDVRLQYRLKYLRPTFCMHADVLLEREINIARSTQYL